MGGFLLSAIAPCPPAVALAGAAPMRIEYPYSIVHAFQPEEGSDMTGGVVVGNDGNAYGAAPPCRLERGAAKLRAR